jgi:hypothetical protein
MFMDKSEMDPCGEARTHHPAAEALTTSGSPSQSTPGVEPSLNRRSFLTHVGVGAAATIAGSVMGLPNVETIVAADDISPETGEERRFLARNVRRVCAQLAFDRTLPTHPDNGEEEDYPYVANFSKGLPHNDLGEVDTDAYQRLLRALGSGTRSDFEAIPLGGDRPLRNPQAGLAYDLEGPDSHHMAIRPAPRIDSPENSSEAGELYWMALGRDVNFTEYDTSDLIRRAAEDMSRFSDFRGPKRNNRVTPATIFRGNTVGDLTGPFVSQFLLKPVPYGTLTISHRQQTFIPATDYITDYETWLNIKRGVNPTGQAYFDPTPRYIRNGRDMAAYVWIDALYEAYLNACLILLGMGAPFDAGNPYGSLSKTDSFATFGGPHILSLVTEVATRALKAVWFQKWYVHRRNRPEEFGGRIHNHITGAREYPINSEILNSAALEETFRQYGTYLLPQVYPEGSPMHPAYGAGHATVAGACVTILKAWFDESWVIPNPVVPNSSGTALVPYAGPDAGSIRVGGELNKVAANIALGRNFAGIHWRTDYSESLKLGEAIAIGILEEQRITYNEQSSFSLTKFDGTRVTI